MNVPVNRGPAIPVAHDVDSKKVRIGVGGPPRWLVGFTPLNARWGVLAGVYVRSCGCGHGPGDTLVLLEGDELMLAHVRCIHIRD